jgi:TolB-like protein/cytochrome c-type biogenesis protein CcmH/NrfG
MPSQRDLGKQAKAETAGEIPRDAVLAALDSLVASAAFGKAERPSRFLRHLVETALRGEGHLLKESVLGMEVFGRRASWDPRLDPVVRQEAARLRKRLAHYYETGSAESEVRIELPVGSYVPVFRRKPVEIDTPPIETGHAGHAPTRRRRVWVYAAAGILCIAIAVIAWRAFTQRKLPASIVVLPFMNLTAGPANQYFSDGLTDEITDSLARIKTLRVTARSSAFQFKGKTVDVREVGRLLHVTNVLEGSVEQSGDRVKIIAHLERTSDGSVLWSNTYERKASDLSAVQSELAADVAGGLRVAAEVPKARHVPNAEAHEFVMKARYDTQQITTESLTRAETEYQHAIDLDPQYSAAYLGLAWARYDQSAARGPAYLTEVERKTTEQLFHKALELDPGLTDAHAMLAALTMQYDWDWGRAERELQLAAAGPSSVNAEDYYAFLLVFRGRFSEAEQHIQRALDRDPFSTAVRTDVSVARNLEGRFAQSREIFQQIAAEYPKMIGPQCMIGLTYIEEGHPELALPVLRQLKQRFPQAQVIEAMAYARAGRREEALRLIAPFEEKYPDPNVAMQWFALVYAFLGDEPNTVKWLERSADRHEFQALSLAVHPVYAPMRNSPGFRALERRMGLDR